MSLVIAVLGAESTGKTTLSRALAQRIEGDTGLRVAWVPEGLRTWCERQGRTPHQHEQAAIAQGQNDAIDGARAAHDVVIADTTSLMTAIYSRLIFGDESLIASAVQHHRSHTLTLVMALDLPWVADGFQRDGPQVQAPVMQALRGLLTVHALPWALVSDAGPARLESAMDAVAPCLRRLPTPKAGLFTRLTTRNAEPAARQWQCERCDDPDCEHRVR